MSASTKTSVGADASAPTKPPTAPLSTVTGPATTATKGASDTAKTTATGAKNTASSTKDSAAHETHAGWTAAHDAFVKAAAARGEDARSIVQLLETEYPGLGHVGEGFVQSRVEAKAAVGGGQ